MLVLKFANTSLAPREYNRAILSDHLHNAKNSVWFLLSKTHKNNEGDSFAKLDTDSLIRQVSPVGVNNMGFFCYTQLESCKGSNKSIL